MQKINSVYFCFLFHNLKKNYDVFEFIVVVYINYK
jgi:hypothetical protein